MEKLNSKNNEKIKYARALARSSAERKASGEFLLEGARLCSDAAESGTEIVRAFFTETAISKYGEYIGAVESVCSECYEISEEASDKISDTGSSQGVFCVCRAPDRSALSLKPGGRYIALENVQDPSNVGAVIRSAEALGIDALIISGGCDIYNPKALRAAMGSSLRMDIFTPDDLPEFIRRARENGMKAFACVPDRSAFDIRKINEISGGKGIICCIGNEGSGLTEQTVNACDAAVTIVMQGRAESLNAAAAAALTAWELKR